jgi:outer membrane protein assembly factor BamB
VNYDQDGAAVLLAYDGRTGKPLWRVERKGYRASYSVPLLRDAPTGGKELVVATTTATTGYDPKTGEQLWSWTADFAYREKGPLRVVAAPAVWKDMVVIQYGDGDGSRRITAIKAPGAGVTPVLAWETKWSGGPYVPCTLIAGDHLFTIGDKGAAACYEITTGKQVWVEERALGTLPVCSSPVLIDGKIYATRQDGEVFVFPATTSFPPPIRSSLGEPVIASPAVADGRLYLRGAMHLFCIGK